MQKIPEGLFNRLFTSLCSKDSLNQWNSDYSDTLAYYPLHTKYLVMGRGFLFFKTYVLHVKKGYLITPLYSLSKKQGALLFSTYNKIKKEKDAQILSEHRLRLTKDMLKDEPI